MKLVAFRVASNHSTPVSSLNTYLPLYAIFKRPKTNEHSWAISLSCRGRTMQLSIFWWVLKLFKLQYCELLEWVWFSMGCLPSIVSVLSGTVARQTYESLTEFGPQTMQSICIYFIIIDCETEGVFVVSASWALLKSCLKVNKGHVFPTPNGPNQSEKVRGPCHPHNW